MSGARREAWPADPAAAEPATVADILWRQVAARPDGPAVIEGDRVLTFAVLGTEVRDVVACLTASGVGRGRAVGLMLENSWRFVVGHYALATLGAVIVPLSCQLHGALLAEAATAAGIDAVVTSSAHLETLRAAGVLQRCAPCLLLDADERAGTEGAVRLAISLAPEAPRRPRRAAAAHGDGRARAGAHAGADGGSPLVLHMSSGTSGRPKAILLRDRQVVFAAATWAARSAFGPDTRSLMAAPFCHVVYTALVLAAHVAGGATVVPPSLLVRTVAREVERVRVTALMGTPAFYMQLLRDAASMGRDLSSLASLFYGAAPMPPSAVEELGRRFPRAGRFNCYGLTETTSILSCLGPEHVTGREDTVGVPHPAIEITIRDARMQEVPRGQIGEICCRGPNVITAYHGVDAAADARFWQGWLRTADLGLLDDEGFLRLVGRVDDVINVAGEKVYPRDVEDVLHRCPGVAEAAVVGVPDRAHGEVVKAYLVAHDAASLSVVELRRFCLQHLPRAFVPRRYELVGSLPRNANGKLMRRDLPAS